MTLIEHERFRIPANVINGALFILALGCWFVGIRLYRVTIVEDNIIFLIVVAGMILSIAFLPYVIQRIFIRWLYFLHKAVIGGGLFYFLFLGLNYQFASEAAITNEFPIASAGTLAKGRHGCAPPYALISFEGQPKQLIFDCASSQLLREARSVRLTYSAGLFGFPVVHAQQLLR